MFTETKALWSTWDAHGKAWGDNDCLALWTQEKPITKGSSSLPVSHLGASQARHGFFQVLSKIQDILYCSLSL